MIELSPGKSVYTYESHLTKANAKKTATTTACFLLGCFYTEDELVGRSLGGKNGKQAEHYFRQWCQDIPREQDNLYWS